MKLGCHAVLFKERIKTDTDTILREFSEMGYKGVEIGSRFFGTDEREFLQEKLAQYGIELSGMHVGSPIVNWDFKPEETAENVLQVAAFMKEMPTHNVLMSGNRQNYTEDVDLKKIARNINEIAKRCKDMGVSLNYHNHDLEFANDGAIYKTLVEYAPDLNFAFDLGWVYVGGFDPIKVLSDNSDRVSYVHLRDAIAVGTREFAEIGEGITDLTTLVNKVKEVVGENGWGVVEYDHGEPNMQRYKNAKEVLDHII